MIIITLKAKLNDAHRDEAIAAAKKMSAHSLTEAGCIDYRFWASVDDPSSFLLLEQWEDQASIDAHMGTPQMAEFAAALGPALDGGMEALKHEVTSSGPLF
ncbi:MAG: antibiotic biosynthesis monooxygenase [Frankiaceae bacterium]|nr:antibiotic biosynthesis monooxygenase [Frankiaceae bacterium]